MATINQVGVGLVGASGSGAFAGNVSPSFTTPLLGTPTSGNLSNCTAYPATSLTGQVPVANGGTGVASVTAYGLLCGGTTTTNPFQSVPDGTSGQLVVSQGAGVLPTWTTSTYPTTNAINTILYASAANTMSALATVTTAVLTTAAGVPTWATELSLALGGTNANLAASASNGGIFYSTATAGAILAGTATAQQLLLSGASTTPQWSTSTYPLTNAANTLLYASSANVMAALATANSSVLVTSGGGVPSLSTTLPSGIAATNMVLTTPKMAVINDSNGSEIILLNPVGGSVTNYFEMTNGTTGVAPIFTFNGSDPAVNGTIGVKGAGAVSIVSSTLANYLTITPTATGTSVTLTTGGDSGRAISIIGTTIADNAPAGYVGELLASANATAVAMSSATGTNIQSLTLTKGDWDVWATFYTAVGAGTVTTLVEAQCHTSTATIAVPTTAQLASINGNYGTSTSFATNINTGLSRWNVSSNTTVYLNAIATYSVSTLTGNGAIYARRVR